MERAMIEKTVQCYRLWPDARWDLVEIIIDVPQGLDKLFENLEYVEAKAVQKAWMEIINQKAKPTQIGLYMPSVNAYIGHEKNITSC